MSPSGRKRPAANTLFRLIDRLNWHHKAAVQISIDEKFERPLAGLHPTVRVEEIGDRLSD